MLKAIFMKLFRITSSKVSIIKGFKYRFVNGHAILKGSR